MIMTYFFCRANEFYAIKYNTVINILNKAVSIFSIWLINVINKLIRIIRITKGLLSNLFVILYFVRKNILVWQLYF